jgi:uncharacterized protein YbjT (DUF2867 family)
MVRSPEAAHKIEARAGVEIVVGDFNDAATIARALAGIDRAFLLTPSSEQAEAQQAAFVEVARRAGVQHIVKLSQWAAALDSPVRFLRYHVAVERAIRTSGLPYTYCTRCSGTRSIGDARSLRQRPGPTDPRGSSQP